MANTPYNYVAFYSHDPYQLPLSYESIASISEHIGITEGAVYERFKHSDNNIIKHGSLSFERFKKEGKKWN